jgi:hypothetical protein
MDSITEKPSTSNGAGGRREVEHDGDDFRKAFLAGVLGAVVASAGYLIYTRLEEEHKDALRQTVVKFVEDKVGDLRAQFKI